MTPADFIFSKRYQVRRHIIFWIAWWLFCSILYSFTPGLLVINTRLIISSTEAALYLIPHIFLSYSLIYFVIPRLLLKSKYALTVISVIAIVALAAVISTVVSLYLANELRTYLMPAVNGQPYHRDYNQTFFLSLLAGLRGAITIGGMAAAIKLMKHWSAKEQTNLILQKENVEARLQLLKAQVHPHFIFNTLNNIYSYAQNTSPTASKLVLGLSDILRYMLYEGDQSAVPLNKEIKMLKEYIGLEKIRYGNKLDVNMEISKSTHSLQIAPLILLPFVENAFKHGASQIIDQPWIRLAIEIEGNVMSMKLVNGKALDYKNEMANKGIGIENVKRRLELLYPKKHALKIQNDPEVFIVDLNIQLERNELPPTRIENPDKKLLHV